MLCTCVGNSKVPSHLSLGVWIFILNAGNGFTQDPWEAVPDCTVLTASCPETQCWPSPTATMPVCVTLCISTWSVTSHTAPVSCWSKLEFSARSSKLVSSSESMHVRILIIWPADMPHSLSSSSLEQWMSFVVHIYRKLSKIWIW